MSGVVPYHVYNYINLSLSFIHPCQTHPQGRIYKGYGQARLGNRHRFTGKRYCFLGVHTYKTVHKQDIPDICISTGTIVWG